MSDEPPVILILRTSAIWGNDRRVVIGLAILLAGTVVPAVYLVQDYITASAKCEFTGVYLSYRIQGYSPMIPIDTVVEENPFAAPHDITCFTPHFTTTPVVSYALLLTFETSELDQ
jgi:hypothetical protein